jgi:bifunctional oligoribonuclease and PAP phosphatase NrnA
MKASEVAALIRRYDNYLILVHHFPDGDAIASSVALGLTLRSLNKSFDIVCTDPVPPQFAFLPGTRQFKRDFLLGDYEVIITLDCGDSRRTGFSSRLKDLIRKKRMLLLNIDHHPKNDLHGLATYNFVDVDAPSTTYLIHQLITCLGAPLDHKLATCLLTGLYTDTGGFKHPNTTAESLSFASTLLAQGARLKDITHHLSQLAPIPRLKLWGLALSRLAHHPEFDIVSTFITEEDIAQSGATSKDVAGVAALVATIPSSVSIIMVQIDNSIQVRMRTKRRDIDVSKLAVYLGGGGQKKSAGFSVAGTTWIHEF